MLELTILELTILTQNVFLTGGVPAKALPIRIRFISLGKQRRAFLSSYKF